MKFSRLFVISVSFKGRESLWEPIHTSRILKLEQKEDCTSTNSPDSEQIHHEHDHVFGPSSSPKKVNFNSPS